MNPTELPASRALEVIAKRLEDQYCAWKGKSRKLNIKKILDGNPDLVRTTCSNLRQYATDRRVIFHYNGHGVPRPTEHGELWFFNSNFSEYLPVSILDIAQWLQTPSLIVLEASSAGKIISSFKKYEPILKQQRRMNNHRKQPEPKNKGEDDDTDELYRFPTMLLAACDDNEILPMNPGYPADIFTSCLTSPIKMALKWFISTQLLHDKVDGSYGLSSHHQRQQHSVLVTDSEFDGKSNPKSPDNANGRKSEKSKNTKFSKMDKKEDDDKGYEHKFSRDGLDAPGNSEGNNHYMALLDMIFDESIGGKKEDKRGILGELHWIFLSVTDTIAWNVLPMKLFQNLFRLDYTVCDMVKESVVVRGSHRVMIMLLTS